VSEYKRKRQRKGTTATITTRSTRGRREGEGKKEKKKKKEEREEREGKDKDGRRGVRVWRQQEVLDSSTQVDHQGAEERERRLRRKGGVGPKCCLGRGDTSRTKRKTVAATGGWNGVASFPKQLSKHWEKKRGSDKAWTWKLGIFGRIGPT